MKSREKPIILRIAGLILSEFRGFSALLIYACSVGLLSLAVPLAVQAVIQNVAAGGLQQPLLVLALLLFLGLALSAGFSMAQIFLVEFTARRIFVHTAERFVNRLREARLSLLQEEGRRLVHRYYDLITIEKSFSTLLVDGLATILQIGVGTALLAVYHPALLAFDIVLLILAMIPFALGRLAAKTARAESTAKFALGEWLDEISGYGLSMRVGSGVNYVEEQTRETVNRWLSARTRHFKVIAYQTGVLIAAQVLVTVGLLTIGGWLVIQGQLTLGQLVAAELVMSATVTSLARLGKLLPKHYDLGVALEKVDEIERLFGEPEGGAVSPDESPWNLSLVDLRPAEDCVPLQLHLSAGQCHVLALPEQGAALSAVIAGADAPVAGRVEINGVDLSDINIPEMRTSMAYIGCDDDLGSSIATNVLVGMNAHKTEDVYRALEEVGLLGEVKALRDGVHTDVSVLKKEARVALSVARALVHQPAFILVDRAFDDVMTATREQLLQTLKKSQATILILTSTMEGVGQSAADEPRIEERAS